MAFYKNKLFIGVSIALVFLVFFIWQNNHIVTNKINYKNNKIPKSFHGYTIVQISDLHNKRFGKNQIRLLNKIEEASPDIIVITGDLIDRRKYNLDIAMEFIEGASKISPIYYVPGNHEAWSGEYDSIKKHLLEAGVHLLEDKKIEIEKEGSKIEILGIKDPAFLTYNYLDGTDLSDLEKALEGMADENTFQILLSHKPQFFNLYQKEAIDLIFTGHAHGGQFRIPFVGGLVAPDQGFFPKYTSGSHTIDKSTMIVNRGLGNSIIPIRIFNRPEIIKLVLKME